MCAGRSGRRGVLRNLRHVRRIELMLYEDRSMKFSFELPEGWEVVSGLRRFPLFTSNDGSIEVIVATTEEWHQSSDPAQRRASLAARGMPFEHSGHLGDETSNVLSFVDRTQDTGYISTVRDGI